MKNRIDIDFEIIWRKLHAQLTDVENEQLENWLSDSKENRAYFLKVENYYKGKQNWQRVSSDEQWAKFEDLHNLKPKPSLQIGWSLKLAAVLVPFLVALLTFIYLDNGFFKSQSEHPSLTKEEIKMNKQKVVLITQGVSYNIKDNNELQAVQSRIDKELTSPTEQILNILKTPKGGEFSFTLSDSSKIWLNAASELRFPNQFNEDERVVELTGEAYFEIKPDPQKPFKVILNGQTVSVLGTSFNIAAYSNETEIVTTLVEGKVNIETASNSPVSINLVKGDQSIYEKKSGKVEKKQVNIDAHIAWKNGKFIFQDESLENIMNIMARWYDLKVVFENTDKKELSFTGEINRYENFENTAEIIQKTNEVQFKLTEKTLYIK